MLHRPEDLSFYPTFVENTVEVQLYEDNGHSSVEDLECYGGLYAGDFVQFIESTMNKIQVQPIMESWFWRGDLAFVPCHTALGSILDFYRRNSRCDVYNRQRFDQVDALSNAVRYTLVHGIARSLDRRLFTRHPVTGVVTEHKFPYITLPEFELTAHPCIAHLHANILMRRKQEFSSPVAFELSKFLMAAPFDWRTLPRSPCPSLTSDTSSSSSSSNSPPKTRGPPLRTARKHPRSIDTSDTNTLPGRYHPGAVKNATRESTRTVEEARPAKKLRLSPRITRKPLRVLTQRPSGQRPAWR
ncbi:hypothetical protein CYLTODRAFT_492951 [Cylindrobasidium torrendii FP15055 ss-10]|uniref:Uncharacterized protein n=1 Tax=Cylindrobasidium torrendii FP15055 ss-10 TaxID=1314674 RepID=A0A0D7B518_9AGAR|nr:hypothetical protein CYLTODRAFT_492951 [Cylindrobasidium torrendii FP15055 ss-10]